MSLFAESARLQLRLIGADRDYLLDIVRAPLIAIVFLALVRHTGRPDLIANALLAPVLMAMWGMALLVSGEVIDADRWLGVLEPTVATPVPFGRLILNRVVVTTSVSLLTLVEVGVVALVGFHIVPPLRHPGVFVAALLATAAAMAGTALLMAALFVATRTARTFQNSLSYPFMLLGGVFVPVGELPAWMRVPARVVFLSWSSDLLRDSMSAAPVADTGIRIAIILGLGGAGFLIGRLTLRRVLGRVRTTGTLGLR